MNKADRTRLDKIAQMPCIVCLWKLETDTPAEVHHLLDTGRRKGHQYTIPLCVNHHRAGVRNKHFVSRHPFRAAFVRRYADEGFLLALTNKLIVRY